MFAKIDLPNDWQRGDCENCPLSYPREDADDSWIDLCSQNFIPRKCELEVLHEESKL